MALSRGRRVHATSPGSLPREAHARMDAGGEAWRKGLAGEQARPERPRFVCAIEGGRDKGSLNSSGRLPRLILPMP